MLALRGWLFLVLACAPGCSEDGTGSTSNGGSAGSSGGASGQGGSAGEAGQGAAGTGGGQTCTPPSGEVGCLMVTLPELGSTEEIVITDEVPSGAGGPLVDGEYEIEAHLRYRSMTIPGETPTTMRAALRIRGGATAMDYAFVEDTAYLPDSEANGFSGAICTSGTLLVTATSCPASDAFVSSYTATGDTFTLFEENEEIRFRRR